jgi:transposase
MVLIHYYQPILLVVLTNDRGVNQEMLIMESRRKILNRHRGGEAIRSISRELNVSRNTVREIIRSDDPPSASYVRSLQPHSSLGFYIESLEKLLRENKLAKPKRTIRHLFEELQLSGYAGSYSSVGRYAAKWKERSSAVSAVACVPLSFAPGEAYQFDWSTDKIVINDEIISVKVAHFVLCYSRKRFTYIYPNETHEMVFDAHIRAFEFFGGTPIRGIYDNMTTAVKKVLVGKEREWNPHFERLCAHYRVEPTACTPASGNEKGIVERQVQISRQQFFTPMPDGNSLQELNDRLASQLITYNKTHKHPEFKDRTLDEVFEKEQRSLVSAPILFDGCKETDIKISTTCLARFDSNSYSVACACAGKIVQCKSYADKVVFIHGGVEVGRHRRRFTRGQAYYNPSHYFPILAKKPGALRNGAPFVDMVLPDELNKVREHLEKQVSGARDFAHILSYIPLESLESVVIACKEAIKSKTISKDVILNILLRQNDTPYEITESLNIVYLPIKHVPTADTTVYNRLLSGVSS